MRSTLLLALAFTYTCVFAQTTIPINGPQNTLPSYYALINATIYTDYQTVIPNATLIIKDGIVNYAGKAITIPIEAKIINCRGKYVYPGFIDLYSNYGIQQITEPKKSEAETQQFISAKKGAYYWNEAIKAEFNAASLFAVDEKKAHKLREAGFIAVLTSLQDGICRGTSSLVLTGNGTEQELMINTAAAGFSFNKGTSRQIYPSSLMGSIALIRQTYYDAKWYASQTKETNLTLQAFNELQTLPTIFATENKLNVLRADKVGDAFGKQYIIKGSGDEYQRIDEIAATSAPLIIPVAFPKPFDVEDPYDADYISTADLKHWELAPYNLAMLAQKQITFAITSDGCSDASTFFKNMKKAVEFGLSEKDALKALTETPAKLLNVNNKIGALKTGYLGNFIITNAPIFTEESKVIETWVKGKQYVVSQQSDFELNGKYQISQSPFEGYNLIATKQNKKTTFSISKSDTFNLIYSEENGYITLQVSLNKKGDSVARIASWISEIDSSNYPFRIVKLDGMLRMPSSSIAYPIRFTFTDSILVKEKKDSIKTLAAPGKITYPFTDFGYKVLPKQQTYLLKNATVWTNEGEGIVIQTDVLIEGGKIKSIGKNIAAGDAIEIDGTNKHITSGIIDEHSHIAISNGVNEGTQSSSSEVRIGDVINSEDINIYRQLAGGVTAAQLLHGSANPIGGQNALVKLRWGLPPEKMKIEGADGFIKFALGENVKQSNWGERNTFRYPQTRMGVEQVFYDGFIRAKAYEQSLKANPKTRRDLELDALVEILQKKRFITCHSYVQSEINMLLHVADSMGFAVNTFTHILEGYKVADKMKKHGVAASTFADWWAYKYEVMEAIPYNAAIMHRMGILTGINSDDAEMGRRLNQEAAKIVKYGGVSEEEAWKMVTLNPAKMLHLDQKMGSIKLGKDADIVMWSENPLSIYAKTEMTFVDGILLYSIEKDIQMQSENKLERERIIQKMIAAKRNGEKTEKKISKPQDEYHCDD